jgi:hypothetical protein
VQQETSFLTQPEPVGSVAFVIPLLTVDTVNALDVKPGLKKSWQKADW